MFAQSSNFYDLIYSDKDYKKEAQQLVSLLSSKVPTASSILDIACGTGEHHKFFPESFAITGLDLNAQFLEAAQKKNPAYKYVQADMRNFDLGEKFDVIFCLFSSIGYVKDTEELTNTLRCFGKHLKPQGLMIIEPWITPEQWYEGRLHMFTTEAKGMKICRMNRSETNGRHSIINFHYLLGTEEEGVQHFEERHELLLLSISEMKDAFHQAGFSVEHEEEGISGRGLYFAQHI